MTDSLAELRINQTRHERELGALISGLSDVKDDVNSIAEDARKSRHDLRNQITVTEQRIGSHVDQRISELSVRIDRMIGTFRWVVGLSVPAVCTLAGILIGKT